MSRLSFVMDVLSVSDVKFEVQLVKLPCPIACLPPRYFSHYVQVPVKYMSLLFIGHIHTKLPSPILPLGWWLNSTACWDTFLLTARSVMKKIKLTNIPTDSDLAFSMLLALGVNVELESILNPIFSSKMQALNQPFLYFKLSQIPLRCFEFDIAGLLNFYSYLLLSARLYSIRSKHT